MVSDKIVANAVGGKTARACDGCIRKRARWYCAADDAFLCQACDASVHSANPLARRHERVRLKTASFNPPSDESSSKNPAPSWHQGFTRKARTPRHTKPVNHHQAHKWEQPLIQNLVPEIGVDENSHDESEEQLLYRVPIFDPFVAELCVSTTSNEATAAVANDAETGGVMRSHESKGLLTSGHEMDHLQEFLPSDMDLADFAADVESLLGRGLDDNESFGMDGLGLLDCKEKDSITNCSLGSGSIKHEDEDEMEAVMACDHVDTEIDMTREPFELNFDYYSPATCEEEEDKMAAGVRTMDISRGYEEDVVLEEKKKKKKILLRLDYDAVITSWSSQASPWINGSRPEFDPDDCWPNCMGTCGTEYHQTYGEIRGIGGHITMGDGGREARVSRYREKRRTRLFSKKIRYEVRKLNAEKRPRMKGRFVKRTSFAGPTFPSHNK